jgi:hypothetical protein
VELITKEAEENEEKTREDQTSVMLSQTDELSFNIPASRVLDYQKNDKHTPNQF